MAIVKGIKLLHKRYTAEQWANGKEPYVLYQGEFGINITTGEVRGYTTWQSQNAPTFTTWASATPLGITIEDEAGTGTTTLGKGESVVTAVEEATAGDGSKYYKVVKKKLKDLTVTQVDEKAQEAIEVVTGVIKDELADGGHALKVTTRKLPTASLEIHGAANANVTETVDGKNVIKSVGVVKQLDGSSTDHNHRIDQTHEYVTTAGYVDSRKLTINAGTQEASQTGGEITYISSFDTVKNENGNHEVTYKTSKYTTPGASTTAAGKTQTNTEKKVLTGAQLGYDATKNEFTITGKEKELLSESDELAITGADGNIIFSLDLSAYATKSDIKGVSGAMTFKGTLNATTSTALTTAINAVNPGGGTAPINGDTYKFITNTGTYTGASFHLADGTLTTTITPDAGDIITCVTDIDGSNPVWYLIPAGDESNGTVETLKPGLGVRFKDVESSVEIDEITRHGIVEHKQYNTTDQKALTTTASAQNDADEKYTFIDGINVDKDGLGHAVQATVKEVTIPKWDAINKAIEDREHVTEIKAGDKLDLAKSTTTNSDGNTVNTYTVSHEKVDTTTDGKTKAGEQAGSGRTYVTGVYRDEYGHISHVTTATETVVDTNTWRGVKYANGESAEYSLLDNAITGASLTLVGGQNVSLEPVSGQAGKLVIKTKGLATDTDFGFIKAAQYTVWSKALDTAGSAVKTYGLGVDKDGVGYVTVDDPTIDRHHAVDENKAKALGFYAVSTDSRGHILSTELITTLDGNGIDSDSDGSFDDVVVE